jgi:uncharacterized membrane protein
MIFEICAVSHSRERQQEEMYMKTKRMDTRYFVTLAMLCGLMLVLQITGIGLIPLPLIKATTMHIPVILGAILLGPTAGSILGALFGLCSIWTNTFTPSALSFAFSPILAYEVGGIGSAFCALWTALGCRILLGFTAGWMWKGMKHFKINDYISLPVTAGLATVIHSLLVMGSIGLMFAQQYADTKNIAVSSVFGVAMGVVLSSGIPEAIAAIFIVTPVGKALLAFLAHNRKRRR